MLRESEEKRGRTKREGLRSRGNSDFRLVRRVACPRGANVAVTNKRKARLEKTREGEKRRLS